jgi:hypothetical protein
MSPTLTQSNRPVHQTPPLASVDFAPDGPEVGRDGRFQHVTGVGRGQGHLRDLDRLPARSVARVNPLALRPHSPARERRSPHARRHARLADAHPREDTRGVRELRACGRTRRAPAARGRRDVEPRETRIQAPRRAHTQCGAECGEVLHNLAPVGVRDTREDRERNARLPCTGEECARKKQEAVGGEDAGERMAARQPRRRAEGEGYQGENKEEEQASV